MSDFECIHCGEIDYRSNHWEACKKHPARKIINELVDEIKQLEEQLMQDDNRAWEALGKPEGTYDTTNVERLCNQIESLKNELDLAHKMHDLAVKERDYERSLVKSLMAELNRKS